MRVPYAFLAIAIFTVSLYGCGEAEMNYAKADRVLTNAVVLTMNADNDTADIFDGSVEFVPEHPAEEGRCTYQDQGDEDVTNRGFRT